VSRRGLAVAALLALLLPAAAFAQTAGVTRSRLPNGLTVIVRVNPAAPVVAYSLLVKMGTRTETPDTAGISNMLQIMLVRGTEKMNGEQIAAAADRMGGSIDAYGDADYSEIAATALSRNWLPMLELVADVALHPTIPDGTVGAVRDFILRQIRNRGDKPFDVASDRMRLALFGATHPYSWDSIGRRESVERLRRDALLAHYQRHYVPEQMALAVSGDVKGPEVLEHVQRLFGPLPPGKAPAQPLPAPPALLGGRDVFTVPGAQAQIFMATLAPPLTHPDFPALKVMTAILGGGMASRFFSDLRDRQALAYSTGALYPPRLDTSGFVATLGTAPANVPKT
jgi:zinc protease